MFEKASRLKVRFESPKGLLSVEDLWDLPLTCSLGNKANLDDIAKALHRKLRDDDDVSFVHKDKKSDKVEHLKFDIVKHIIDVRLAENQAREAQRANAEKKQRILEIIASKEDESLKGMDLEALKKMVEGLGE